MLLINFIMTQAIKLLKQSGKEGDKKIMTQAINHKPKKKRENKMNDKKLKIQLNEHAKAVYSELNEQQKDVLLDMEKEHQTKLLSLTVHEVNLELNNMIAELTALKTEQDKAKEIEAQEKALIAERNKKIDNYCKANNVKRDKLNPAQLLMIGTMNVTDPNIVNNSEIWACMYEQGDRSALRADKRKVIAKKEKAKQAWKVKHETLGNALSKEIKDKIESYIPQYVELFEKAPETLDSKAFTPPDLSIEKTIDGQKYKISCSIIVKPIFQKN